MSLIVVWYGLADLQITAREDFLIAMTFNDILHKFRSESFTQRIKEPNLNV